MLDIHPNCENCGKSLPVTAADAMICTYECTFCADCVQDILHNVCPNCGGGFEKRPVRPSYLLKRDPPKTKNNQKPINWDKYTHLLPMMRDIPPELR